jgi:hypothetical protein
MPAGYLVNVWRLAFGVWRSAFGEGCGQKGALGIRRAALLTDRTYRTHKTNMTDPPTSPMSPIGPICSFSRDPELSKSPFSAKGIAERQTPNPERQTQTA